MSIKKIRKNKGEVANLVRLAFSSLVPVGDMFIKSNCLSVRQNERHNVSDRKARFSGYINGRPCDS